MDFRIICKQLNQCSYAINISFIRVLTITADNLGFEFANWLVAVKRYLADGFFEVIREVCAEDLKEFDDFLVFEGG